MLAADANHGGELARRWCAACHLVDSAQKQASADVPSFAMIAQKSDSVGNLVEGISAALQAQKEATSQLARHIEGIAKMADQSTVSTEQIANGVHDINTAASTLHAALNRFRLAA